MSLAILSSAVPALEELAVPNPIGAEEADTGAASLAMAAAALDEADAARIAERLEPSSSAVELAEQALTLGYHAHLYTPEPEPDEVSTRARQAGLLVHGRAEAEDVETALASRHPVVVSAPGDGPPFLLVIREDGDELLVDDPSVEERPLTWSWERFAELLEADPAPRVLELGARSRADR